MLNRCPTALVTDGEFASSLAVCRGLSAAGYRVSSVASSRLAVSHWTRSVSNRYLTINPLEDSSRYIDELAAILKEGSFDVIVAATEASLIPISINREAIEQYVQHGLPDHKRVLRALDKVLLQNEASKFSLTSPQSFTCTRIDDVIGVADVAGFPLIIKPARSFRKTQVGLEQKTATVAFNEKSLIEAVVNTGMPITVQEFLDDASIVSVAGVKLEKAIEGFTVARYARTYPQVVGSASLAKTIEPPAGLQDRVNGLLSSIGWVGVFELELLESKNGQLAAIDLNPRPFGWITLAIEAGANLPAIWCDRILGRKTLSRSAKVGIYYIRENGEAINFLKFIGARRISDALSAIQQTLRATMSNATYALFRLKDPLPLFMSLLESIISRISAALNRSNGSK